MVFLTPEIDLFVIAASVTVIFSIISIAIRHKLVGKEKLKELKKKHTELKELMKKRDKESQKRLKELQMEVLEINMKMLRAQMPTMGLSLLVLVFLIPFINTNYAKHTFPVVGSAIWYYIVVSIITSIVFQLIVKKMGKE